MVVTREVSFGLAPVHGGRDHQWTDHHQKNNAAQWNVIGMTADRTFTMEPGEAKAFSSSLFFKDEETGQLVVCYAEEGGRLPKASPISIDKRRKPEVPRQAEWEVPGKILINRRRLDSKMVETTIH